jgi:aminoglycoside phosphotransferase (APT) family kinase protein
MHADLHPGNLLVAGGRVSGVIDWGSLSVGDPATELLFAWMVLDPPSRTLFRELIGVDDATWLRGRGWALSMALIALPYYWDTNPVLVSIVGRALAQVLGES